MNILMLSIDKKVFDENSPVRQRLFNYGTLVNRLDVVVLNRNNQPFRKTKIGENVYLHPTNSPSKFLYFFDAIKLVSELKNPKFAITPNNRQTPAGQRIDLITAQDPYETGFIAWCLAKKFKTKLELQIHTDIFNPQFFKHSILNKIRSIVAMFLLRKADHIRVVSKRIKNSLPKKIQNNKSITVSPIFISPIFIQATVPKFSLKEKYPQFKFIILMMSRLEKEKNISLTISALKEVAKVFPKTGLIIVGEGSLRDVLRQQVRRAGLEENVVFKKWTNDPISYYKTADLFLSSSNYEGYGLSLAEAILSRCPILTTKAGIAGEILSGNNAFLCDVGNKKCLIQNIIKAQQYPSLLSQFKLKAFTDFTQKTYHTEGEYLTALQKSWQNTIDKK